MLCSISGCVFRCSPDVESNDSVSVLLNYLLILQLGLFVLYIAALWFINCQ